jgi:hypothetical protein
LLGKQRKEFAEGGGPRGPSERGERVKEQMKKGTKQLWVRGHIHHTGKTCVRRLTCFRHLVHPPQYCYGGRAGRSILLTGTGTTCAPHFRPRKHLITNECQPIPPYSRRGVPPLPIPASDLRLLASVVRRPPFLHSAFFLLPSPGRSRARSCPIVQGVYRFHLPASDLRLPASDLRLFAVRCSTVHFSFCLLPSPNPRAILQP